MGEKLAWFGRLSDQFAALFLGRPQALQLSFDANITQVSRKHDKLLAPASLLRAGGPVVAATPGAVVDIILPSDVLLVRSITAPRSARGKLAEVATLDLMRKTPFKMADVHVALSPQEAGEEELKASQWVIKRGELDAILRRLQELGLRTRKVLIDAGGRCITLVDRTHSIAPKAKIWLRSNLLLLLVAGALALFLWLHPGWRAQAALAELEPVLSERRTKVVALRQELDQRNASATQTERFLQTVVRRPKFIEILRILTVTLPDEVWLSDIVLRDGNLVVSGETSGSATDLVLALAKAQEFSNARLSGPVSKVATGAERFQIALELGAS